MKFVPLHTKNTAIVYKNSLCSGASFVVLVFLVLSVMVPVLLVSLLSPYSGIIESRVLYEQPRLEFLFQSIFLAKTLPVGRDSDQLVACSTFAALNERLNGFGRNCAGSKYWSEDLNHDGRIDRAHFQLQLDDVKAVIKSWDLVLFFETKLQHKCTLSPPAVLTHRLTIPHFEQLSGAIHLKAELQLKQNMEFICPFPGRKTKTHFRHVKLDANSSSALDLKQFQLESLLQQVKANPAYFELQIKETYFRQAKDIRTRNFQILLDVDVMQVPARYHLSVWERLGQFWLYFASFFGISFYIMNKLKDFLFGRQIIRSWEIIPWKKLY